MLYDAILYDIPLKKIIFSLNTSLNAHLRFRARIR